VTLHELIAFSEWANEFGAIELRDDAERVVLSRLQQALAHLIPSLGTPTTAPSFKRAWGTINRTA
jgi:hypothetical protein